MTTICACGRPKTRVARLCILCSNRRQIVPPFDPAFAAWARQCFADGYGPRWIAANGLAQGRIAGVTYEALVQRIGRWRHVEGIPLLRERRAVRGQPVFPPGHTVATRRENEERLARERAAAEAAALRLVRPWSRCGFCDTRPPGRQCVACGAVAPSLRERAGA